MVAINPEMLRELLDEFTEKEAVTREEMNAINQQIAELEKRIETSKVKLAGLNRDREKINAMQDRYLSGNWKVQLSNIAESAAQIDDQELTADVEAGTPDAPVAEASAVATASAEPVAAAPVASAAGGHTPAEGRAARRAAREAAKEAARESAPKAEAAPVSAPTPASAPTPVAAPVPAAAPVIAPVAAPVAEISASEPVAESVQSEPVQSEPVISAPTFTAVADDRSSVWGEPAPAAGQEAAAADSDNQQADDLDQAAQIESESQSSIEHAPPDDPIMSSFNSAPSGANAPDVASALAHSVQEETAAAVEDTESSGFSWSSTAIAAVPGQEQPQAQDIQPAQATPGGAPVYATANPWGEPASAPAQAPAASFQQEQPVQAPPQQQQPIEQRQTPADIWGQPSPAPAANGASPQGEAGWGNFGQEWQMKEAESQKTTAANLPASSPVEAPTAGGWGQPGASPWGQASAAADPGVSQASSPAASAGGWGQPTASRTNLPAQQPAQSQPQPSPFAPPAQQSQSGPLPQAGQGGEPVADAWGRSSQPSSAWGAPSAPVSSPWGEPAQAAAPAPTQAQGDIFGTQPPPPPEAAQGEGEQRSSLARAADGALISPVKGRRRGPGTPAAFDWGQPDPASGNDPGQAGASEEPNDNKKIDDVLKGLFK